MLSEEGHGAVSGGTVDGSFEQPTSFGVALFVLSSYLAILGQNCDTHFFREEITKTPILSFFDFI